MERDQIEMGGLIRRLRFLALRAFLAWVFVAPFVSSAWGYDKGWDFRATSGFVTDPPNTTYVLDTDLYPTTRNSTTFGWINGNDPGTLGGGGRDRDAGVDPRIAGMNFVGNQIGTGTFRVDGLTPGTYTFTIGYGDAGGNSANTYFSVKNLDGSNVIAPLHVPTLATPTFGDASGATWTAAAWPGSQVTVSGTINGTSINVWIGSGLTTDGTNSLIDTLFIHQAAASTSVQQSWWLSL